MFGVWVLRALVLVQDVYRRLASYDIFELGKVVEKSGVRDCGGVYCVYIEMEEDGDYSPPLTCGFLNLLFVFLWSKFF